MKILLTMLFLAISMHPMAYANAEEITLLQPSEMIIFQVKTEGNSAAEEYMLLYNQSPTAVDMMGWCLSYTTAGDNPSTALSEICIDGEFLVLAGEFVSFGTNEFVAATGYSVDFLFVGGMNATGGHMRLFDMSEQEVDKVGWGTAVAPELSTSLVAPAKHNKQQTLSRHLNASELDTNDNFNDFTSRDILYQCPVSKMLLSADYFVDKSGLCMKRFCPNLIDSTLEAPDGYYKPDGQENCELLPVALENAVLFITEIYPNAPSSDDGKEFIELYNPNDRTISLTGYTLQLGPDFTKQFIFSGGDIKPNEYIIFSDTITGIVLPNSTGQKIRLIAPDSTIVSDSTSYSNAQDDESWSLVEDQWIWTNQITPAAANKPFLVPAVDEVEGVTSILAPCPAGKFRNPDTNRCKTLETAVSLLAPCDEDEFRNPETNRCNKVSASSASLTPCKVGQVRNPETNRCRAVESSSSLQPCEEGEERNAETNRCRKVSVLGATDDLLNGVQDVEAETSAGQLNIPMITAVLGATIGYIVYEWRVEISRYFRFRKTL